MIERGPSVVLTATLTTLTAFTCAACVPATAFMEGVSVSKQFDDLMADARISSSLVTGYRIEAMGQAVGVALAGQNLGEGSGPEQSRIYLFDKMGNSPTLHAVSLSLGQAADGASTITGQYRFIIDDQVVSEYHYEWAYANGKMNLRRGQASTLFPEPLLEISRATKESTPLKGADKPISLPFFNPTGKGQQLVFDPFHGQLAGTAEQLAAFSATYDSDGFARTLSWNIIGKLPMTFTRADKAELAKFYPTLWRSSVPLNDFTPESELGRDLAKLRQTASLCSDEATSLQDRFVKKSPNVPYLLHRRVTVLKNLCSGTAQFAKLYSQTRDPEKRTRCFTNNVRLNLSQHPSELPLSVIRSPQWAVIFDDQKTALWVNSLNDLIHTGLTELTDSLAIEMERKKVVKLRTVLKGKSLGAVIKAVVTNTRPGVAITLNESKERTMLPDSWRGSPWAPEHDTSIAPQNKSTKANRSNPARNSIAPSGPTFPFQLYNGKSLALTRLSGFEQTCRSFGGRVGIDLGDAPQSVLNGPEISGGWDASTRLRLMQLFLRKASAYSTCTELIVRVPPELKPPAEEEIQRFNESILQTDQEFQLKNAKFRHLRMLPGTYTIHVHSLISGTLLANRELVVEDTEKPQSFTLNINITTESETASTSIRSSDDSTVTAPSQSPEDEDGDPAEDLSEMDSDDRGQDRFGSTE
jgi:hypothetical protein